MILIYHKYKSIIVFLILFFLSFVLNAQNKKTLNGVIKDASTGKPIPHVELFISGTTVGCISDTNGVFNLKLPFVPCTLVADHVSYDSYITVIQSQVQQLQINLTPSMFSIDEVKVSSKNRRRMNLRYFYSHFIPENRNKIKILNDSILTFQRDEMEFTASTNEPLILVNNLLGYKIKVILKQFRVISTDSPGGKRVSLDSPFGGDVMQLTGYYYYEPLVDSLDKKNSYYEKNRRLNYYGSYRHFLKSVYDKKIGDQGFYIETIPSGQEHGITEIESEKLDEDDKIFIFTSDSLKITYYFNDARYPVQLNQMSDRNYVNYSTSMIYSDKEPFIVRKNGTSPKLPFLIDGKMVIKNFANSLPEDYVPPE